MTTLESDKRLNALKSKNIDEKSELLTARDGARIGFTHWKSSKSNEKIVVVIHGLGIYSSAYRKLAENLCPSGYQVYAIDLRCHGNSDGHRGSLPNRKILFSDVDEFVKLIANANPESKLYLLGESMGGLISLAYMKENVQSFSGLLLLAPALRVKLRQLLSIDSLLFLFLLIFSPKTNFIDITGWRLDLGTVDRDLKNFMRTDPRVVKKINASYIGTLAWLIFRWKAKYPNKILVPSIIFHGTSDMILNYKKSKKLFSLIDSRDKELKIYDNAKHSLLADPVTPTLLQTINEWLNKH